MREASHPLQHERKRLPECEAAAYGDLHISRAGDPFYATDSYWDYRHLFDKNITVNGMNPAFVGPYLFEAVEENHMYKVPHMHTHEQIRARHRRIEADLEREEQLHKKYAPLQKY